MPKWTGTIVNNKSIYYRFKPSVQTSVRSSTDVANRQKKLKNDQDLIDTFGGELIAVYKPVARADLESKQAKKGELCSKTF